MKRLLALLLGIVLILWVFSACETGTGPYRINPPSWIAGSWEDDTGTFEWTFTSDNVVFSMLGIVGYDFKELAKDPDFTVADSSTSTTYVISLTESGNTDEHSFEKLTDMTVSWTARLNGMVYLDSEELTKQ